MKFILPRNIFAYNEEIGTIIRGIISVIALIIIIIYGTFYYQNAFNYEIYIYSYYTFALILSTVTFIYVAISMVCMKKTSDYTDFLLIPGLLFLLYSLKNGKEYTIVLSSVYILFFIIKSSPINFLLFTLYLIIAVYLIQVFSTLYNYINGNENNHIYKNTGIFSIYCIIFMPTCFYFVTRFFHSRNIYLLCGFYFFSILFIIIFLGSRTAIFSLLTVFIAPYIIKFLKHQEVRIKIVITILYVVLICFGTYFLFNAKQGSSFGRMLMIEVSFKHINEYFWFGTGLGNFTFLYPNWQSEFFNNTQSIHNRYFLSAGESYVIFNEFLQLFMSIGAVLFSCLSFLIIRFFLVKKAHDLLYVIKITFLIILSCSLTYYTLHINIVLIMIAFYSALTFKLLFVEKNIQKKYINILRGINLLTALLAMYVFHISYEKYNAIEGWSMIKNSYDTIGDSEKKIQQIRNQLQNDGKFLADYGNYIYEHESNVTDAVYYIEKAHNSFINLESKETLAYLYLEKKDYTKAINAFEWLVNYIPNKFKYRLNLIELYFFTNNKEKALKLANTTLNIPIKIQSKEVDNIKRQITDLITKFGNNNKLN